MAPDTALLQLTQWLSPAFPTGGYAYSQGLETAIADNMVQDAAGLLEWLRVSLTAGALWSDAVILSVALTGDLTDEDLSAEARARAGGAERLAETEMQGAAFTATHNALNDTDYPPAPLPVAVGRAARRLDLPPAQVIAIYLQAALGTLVLGAVRHIPLGQTQGQRVLSDLTAPILQTATEATRIGLDDLGTCSPGADLAVLRHETQQVRIFRS